MGLSVGLAIIKLFMVGYLMKILHVISSFPPTYQYGGAPIAAFNLCRELAKRKNSVTVFTTDAFAPCYRLPLDHNPTFMEGIEIYRFKNISNYLCYKNCPIAPGILQAIKQNLHEYDIVHLHEYVSIHAAITNKQCKALSIPYVLQPHGSITSQTSLSYKDLYSYLIGRNIIKESDKIIANTILERNKLNSLRIEDNRIAVIPNLVDLIRGRRIGNGSFREKYMISPKEKIILFVGRIHRIKGLSLLIEAFYELLNYNSNIRLVIVGPDNGYLNQLKNLIQKLSISDKILISGPLYGDDKAEAYQDADLFVLPSTYESFGIVALEAALFGLPVIITNRCGISDYLSDIAYIINYDKAELFAAMRNALNCDRSKIISSEENNEFLHNQFNSEHIVNAIENIYSKAITSSQ
jgi:glycosyltransferase involved in cell wall biosynthesis